MKYDVFLSYSRKDSETMRRVRDDLRAAGLRVWTDEALEAGTEVWELEIEKAIRASHSLVVLLSPDSHDFEWVRNEITLADAINRRIVPMLLRGEQGESIPLRLISSQWIDARTDYQRAIAQLTTTIKNHALHSNVAVTVKMERGKRVPHVSADTMPHPLPIPQNSPTRIPLAVGVAATLAVIALVAVALVLANSVSNNPPEQTVEAASVTSTETNLPRATDAQTIAPTQVSTLAAVVPTTLQGQIAFVSNRTSASYDIYMIDLGRHRSQLLWQNPYTEAYVAWSADGGWLSFTSWTPPDYAGDIYTLRLNGNRFANLTNNTYEDRYARWSPDGTQMVFESQREGEDVDIWTMNADGSHQTDITNDTAWDSEPAWSPDGEHIAFTTNRADVTQIWLMNVDGSDAVNLTPDTAHHGHAEWSPDGTRIAYSRCVSPAPCDYENVDGTDDNWDIWVMNADGSNPIQLTDDPASDLVPTWSPDGTELAFVSYRDGNAEIYVMNADGSGQVNITNNPAADFGPAWRP